MQQAAPCPQRPSHAMTNAVAVCQCEVVTHAPLHTYFAQVALCKGHPAAAAPAVLVSILCSNRGSRSSHSAGLFIQRNPDSTDATMQQLNTATQLQGNLLPEHSGACLQKPLVPLLTHYSCKSTHCREAHLEARLQLAMQHVLPLMLTHCQD
jgi:hypothetical protein